MRETEKRLEAYTKELPKVREKIVATLFLFIMSIVMLSSATFAWITISTSPEVEGIATTVAANGNLEVALASQETTTYTDDNGEVVTETVLIEPDESAVGDSNLELIEKNTTWGNLINLSDPIYGLEDIVLRPAMLNTSSLLTSPLTGVSYGDDGRIDQYISQFAYTSYDEKLDSFVALNGIDNYGVRAISSATYTYAEGEEVYASMLEDVSLAIANAKATFQSLYADDADGSPNDYMDVLCELMGDYLTAEMNDTEFSADATSMSTLLEMMFIFDDSLEACGDAYVTIANMQLMQKVGDSAVFYTDVDELRNESDPRYVNIDIPSLEQYLTDVDYFATYLTEAEALYTEIEGTSATVSWDEIDGIIGCLLDVNSTTVGGVPVSTLKSAGTGALDYVSITGNNMVVIQSGLLVNMEDRLGTRMYVDGLEIPFKYIFSMTLKATITTAATKDELNDQYKVLYSYEGGFVGGDAVAKETYGLAIDFWVRSNAESGYLTLEGDVVTETIFETTTKYYDTEGNELVYNAENDKVYDSSNNEVTNYTTEEVKVTNADGDYISTTVVTGFEGANRVWEEVTSSAIDISTTQGTGSCFVFYADPSEYTQTLNLLKSIKVAFVDDEGNHLADAYMNIDEVYEDGGKYTVPLQLSADTAILAGTEVDGSPIYGITKLTQGESEFVTAILYVDGTSLTNEQVLSASEVQGQLNIQFSSTANLEAVDDEVMYETLTISASADQIHFDEEEEAPYESMITVMVDGVEPNTVTANFIRQISATQGTLQEAISFTQEADGTWTADTAFTAPGTYVLRSVKLDGVEYDLPSAVEIEIEGWSITSLSCDITEMMTSDTKASANLSVDFAGNSIADIQTVKGYFENEDGQQTTVNFVKKDTDTWSGTAAFTTSGTYQLTELLVDGEYYALGNFAKTVDLSLGMKASVIIESGKTNIAYDGTLTDIGVYLTIVDDKGDNIEEAEDVILVYQHSSSSSTKMDSNMTWNADTNRYEGTFQLSSPGTYKFSYVKVGEDTLTTAIQANSISAVSTSAADFYAYTGYNQDFQFAPNNDATMTVAMENMSGATLTATVTSDTYTGSFQITGTESSYDATTGMTIFKFVLSAGSGLSQDGTWTLQSLSASDVYAENESGSVVYYSAYSPKVWDVSGENYTTTVATNIVAKVSGTSETFTGDFMTAHIVSGTSVSIAYSNGDSIDASDVKLTYTLDLGSLSTYGYSADITDGSITASGTKQADGTFLMDDMVFNYAGAYKASLSFKVGNTTYTQDDVSFSYPSYDVKWNEISATFTGVSPTSSFTTNKDNNGDYDSVNDTVTNTYTATSATVYHQYATTDGGSCGTDSIDSTTASKVTITLAGIGSNFTSASMSFVGSKTATYSFTATSLSNEQTIGSDGTTTATILGTATANTVAVVYNNKTYTITLPSSLTINNPY